MDEYQHLKLEQRDGILTVTLNRPERLNAGHGPMIDELLRVVEVLSRHAASTSPGRWADRRCRHPDRRHGCGAQSDGRQHR